MTKRLVQAFLKMSALKLGAKHVKTFFASFNACDNTIPTSSSLHSTPTVAPETIHPNSASRTNNPSIPQTSSLIPKPSTELRFRDLETDKKVKRARLLASLPLDMTKNDADAYSVSRVRKGNGRYL